MTGVKILEASSPHTYSLLLEERREGGREGGGCFSSSSSSSFLLGAGGSRRRRRKGGKACFGQMLQVKSFHCYTEPRDK